MDHITAFVKKEAVLCIAGVMALCSCFFIPPDSEYLTYMNMRVLILLFCLMAVVQAMRNIAVFDRLCAGMLKKVGSIKELCLMLVMLCMFMSMLLTNDVTLVTMVPFTLMLFGHIRKSERICMHCLVMETVSANLGSMLTPFGNPQNLYLYSTYDYKIIGFMRITAPLFLLSLVLVFFNTICVRGISADISFGEAENKTGFDNKRLLLYIILFGLCIMSVLRLLNVYILLAVVSAVIFVSDKKALAKVDYLLLVTFVFFFIFTGNTGRIPLVSNMLANVISGRELTVSVLASQLISNVPAAVLLSNFTDNADALVAGTNIGGLGTLIASMASLITYKYYASHNGADKGSFVRHFSLINLEILVILYIFGIFLMK